VDLQHNFGDYAIGHGGEPNEAVAVAPAGPAAVPLVAPPQLTWRFMERFKNDALWWFDGEQPVGFSTTARLHAFGYRNPANLNWQITEGGDKVAFQQNPNGSEVVLESINGSIAKDDVAIEVREGAAAGDPNYIGRLSVRKPHRLIRLAPIDTPGCPSWGGCSNKCTSYWSQLPYRIVDNLDGTIVGATVNELFPSAKIDDDPNSWRDPFAQANTVPFWQNTNGTFVDHWFMSCDKPYPVPPTAGTAYIQIDHMAHEFFVGSKIPGVGVRVQKHTAVRYLGFARHENITTPAL
jgi:hypothetical protein